MLRSGLKNLPTGPTDMASPTNSTMQHTAGTPTHESTRIIKLTPPKQTPSPSLSSQDSTDTTQGTQSTPPIMNLESLHKSIADLGLTVTSLNTDLKLDIKKAGILNSKEMDKLEARLLASQEQKYDEINKKLLSNFETHNTKIVRLEAENAKLQQSVRENEEKRLAYMYNFVQLRQEFDDLQIQVDNNQKIQEEFEDITKEDIIELRKTTRAALHLANSVEAHVRRWAIRTLGLPAPTVFEIHENYVCRHRLCPSCRRGNNQRQADLTSKVLFA
jgi:hypothetical protein